MSHDDYTDYREKYIAIDIEHLEEEWQAQPVLYDRAQQAVIAVERKLKEVDRKLIKLESILQIKIKNDPEKYNLPNSKSPTVKDVDAVINRQKKHILLVEEKQEIEFELAEARNFVRSLEMKKSTLAKLVDLWIGNYYSTPQINKSAEGKKFSNFIYDNLADKQRKRLLEGANKRKQEREKVMDRIASKPAKKQLDGLLDDEERRDRLKRKKMFGLEQKPLKRIKKRKK